MQKKADYIIIGAGVLGSSLAYYLTKKGRDVIVLERGEICDGVSSTTAALVLPSPKTPAVYNQLAWKGYERFLALEEELGADIGLQITGSTMLCRAPEKMDGMKATIEVNKENGKTLQWLTPEEICEREPILNPEAFCGGVYCAEGGNLNPFLLVNAYIQAAKRNGAQVYTFTEVRGFEVKNHRITTIHTNKGDYEAGQIISTAGNGNFRIGKELGFDPHIHNTRGLIMVSEKLPKVLHSTYAEMRQSAEGNLLMGANFRIVESGTSDNRVYYDELQEVCDDIGFLAPKLRSVKVIRTYSGLRVLPEDGLPIVGQPGRYENLWIYEMHSAFSSSPELSWRLAEILCGDMDTEAIETFKYERFDK